MYGQTFLFYTVSKIMTKQDCREPLYSNLHFFKWQEEYNTCGTHNTPYYLESDCKDLRRIV